MVSLCSGQPCRFLRVERSTSALTYSCSNLVKKKKSIPSNLRNQAFQVCLLDLISLSVLSEDSLPHIINKWDSSGRTESLQLCVYVCAHNDFISSPHLHTIKWSSQPLRHKGMGTSRRTDGESMLLEQPGEKLINQSTKPME